MKKKTGSILRMMMMIMVLVVSYHMVSFAEEDAKFVRGTKVNDISISGLTVEEAKARISRFYAEEYKLAIVGKEGTFEYISGGEVGYQVTIPTGLQEILDAQNASGRILGPAAETLHTIKVTGASNEKALAAKIQALSSVSGPDLVLTADAHISEYQEGQAFKIIPEIRGSNVSVEKVTEAVTTALKAGQNKLSLIDTGCYYEVAITSENQQLKELCEIMNQCKDMIITYTFGEEVTELLGGDVITTWLTGSRDGQILVNRESAAEYVNSLAHKYDTVEKSRMFHTAAGKDVELTGPYGWKINQETELDALIGMIRTGQSQSREPEYTKKAVSRAESEWGNTYVEIDLTGQHVYGYKDGTQVWDAPCVTGNISKEYTTPPGIYSLTYKERDKVLRGKKLEDGKYEYESPVKYWMPFNGGIGLHDADWRSKFGGTIYQKSGSHGCINLPPAKVPPLYDLVYTGIPVICYN